MPDQTLTGDITLDQIDENVAQPVEPVPPGVIRDQEGNEIDLAANINDLLGQIQTSGFDRAARLQDMFLELGANVDPTALTASEQTALNTIKDNIARTADADRESAVALLTHRGFGRSTDIAETFGHFAEKKLMGQAQAAAGFIMESAGQKRAQQTDILGMAANMTGQLISGNLEYARILMDAYQATVNTDLSRDMLELQRDIFNENASLGRDKFTEEQKQNMIDAGYTDRQITIQEEALAFETEMRQKEFTASNDLAQKNFGLQEKVLLGNLALDEIKNNHNMDIQTRAQQLAETVQLGTLDIETDKFELYAKQLEREYGLDLNRFELARFIETGRLSNDILNSQRAYDLQDEKQKNDFLLSSASLKLQELLGMRELDIRAALGQGQLSVERERNAIMKWANEANIRLDERALNAQIQQYRDQSRGNLLGALIGGVVKLGAAWMSGGASEMFLNSINGSS